MPIRRFLLILCALLLAPATGKAAVLAVDAPKNIPTGTAFVITITTDSPESVKVEWQKAWVMLTPAAVMPEATVTEQGDKEGDQKFSPARYSGQALLPVNINAEPGNATLACTPSGAGAKPFIRDIAITANAFETQELTVEGKYVNPPQSVQARIDAERTRNREALAEKTPERLWSLPFIRPVPGAVTSSFGLRRVFNKEPRAPHMGLDLRGAAGTPIFACAAGTVLLAEEQYYAGNCVFIDHGMGVITSYMHMSALKVTAGQTVARGELIGLVGATGRVTGPHLHLGLSILGTPVDPLPLLETPSKS